MQTGADRGLGNVDSGSGASVKRDQRMAAEDARRHQLGPEETGSAGPQAVLTQHRLGISVTKSLLSTPRHAS